MKVEKKRKSGISPGLIGFGVVLLVAAGGFVAGRRNHAAREVARAGAREAAVAARAQTPAQRVAVETATRALAVLSADRPDFDGFQERWSGVAERMRTEAPDLSPPAQSALAIRATIEEMGYAPSETILYWLSPQFREDVAARDPAAVTSATRTVDYLVSVALADGLSDEEFTRVLSGYSPAVWEAARQRRAARR